MNWNWNNTNNDEILNKIKLKHVKELLNLCNYRYFFLIKKHKLYLKKNIYGILFLYLFSFSFYYINNLIV